MDVQADIDQHQSHMKPNLDIRGRGLNIKIVFRLCLPCFGEVMVEINTTHYYSGVSLKQNFHMLLFVIEQQQ
jgi:hypothetical protein